MKKLRVLVIGCGNMGSSHARAYHKLADNFEICGIVDKFEGGVKKLNEAIGTNYKRYEDFDKALAELKPDCVAIATYPATHAEFAIKAMKAGCHVFLEKPIATNAKDADLVVETAKKLNKKLVIGYILRHHPSWIKFIEIARTLGKPLVMRMNLNQQSHGAAWNTHKNILASGISPMVDCGVHYIDVMCQMTNSSPSRVAGVSARLSDEIKEDNYSQMQVAFKDGSVAWYEAGWGPMASNTAFFVKDVWGPKGSASITMEVKEGSKASDDVNSHTKTNTIKLHSSKCDADGNFVKNDEYISTEDEPDHYELCAREQKFFYNSIVNDVDLTDHLRDAVNSLKIALAADESALSGKMVYFDK